MATKKAPAKKAPRQFRWEAKTQVELAAFFCVDEERIRAYRKAGFPTPVKGVYDLSACTQWFVANERKKVMREMQALPVQIEKVELQKMKLDQEVRKLKYENDERQGRLLDRDDVQREIVQWALNLRTRLMGLVDKLVNIVPADLKAAIKMAVTAEIRTTLKEAFETEIVSTDVKAMVLEEAERIKQGESE